MSAEKKQDCSANKHIHYLLKFEEKNQLASETLPGQQEGQKAETSRRETALWWGAPSGLHVNTQKLLGLKQTPEPARESDGTLSEYSLTRGSAKPTWMRVAWNSSVPYGSANHLQNLCSDWSWTKIVWSTDTNGVKLELGVFFWRDHYTRPLESWWSDSEENCPGKESAANIYCTCENVHVEII